jgi:hypothetical protein
MMPIAKDPGFQSRRTSMTQRGAVLVGCRLIAVYLVFNTISEIAFYAIGGGTSGSQFMDLLQRAAVLAMVRMGVGVLLWVGAPRIARLAAEPEEEEADR